MLARSGKTSANEGTLTKIYTSQLEDLERWLAAQREFEVLVVQHRRLLEQPGAVAEEINRFLGGELDVSAMANAVDPSLYRQRAAS
jgi:hypothetical protein